MHCAREWAHTALILVAVEEGHLEAARVVPLCQREEAAAVDGVDAFLRIPDGGVRGAQVR